MKNVDCGLCGNQHLGVECYYSRVFDDLFSLDGEQPKPIWKLVQEGKLCAYPSFKGDKYEESELRLMVVGRAMNGWGTDFHSCTSADSLAQMVLQQTFDFSDVVNEKGLTDENDPERKKYFYSKSNFWKLIKQVLEIYQVSDNGNWYNDSHEWQKQIVWSNLYKVAPKNTGNPDWALIKMNMKSHVEIMCREIQEYHPKRILFVTDMNYFYPWKRQPSFAQTFGVVDTDEYTYVVAKGTYRGASIVVCRRPDTWGTSDENIRAMAHEIKHAFGD